MIEIVASMVVVMGIGYAVLRLAAAWNVYAEAAAEKQGKR